MTGSELIRAIAMRTSLTQPQAREAIAAMVQVIAFAANEDEDVIITRLGKFSVKNRAEGIKFNPGTGEKVTVPAHKTMSFKPSKLFKSLLVGGRDA